MHGYTVGLGKGPKDRVLQRVGFRILALAYVVKQDDVPDEGLELTHERFWESQLPFCYEVQPLPLQTTLCLARHRYTDAQMHRCTDAWIYGYVDT